MKKVSCKEFVSATRGAGADVSVEKMVKESMGKLVRAANMILDTCAGSGTIITDIDNIHTEY